MVEHDFIILSLTIELYLCLYTVYYNNSYLTNWTYALRHDAVRSL